MKKNLELCCYCLDSVAIASDCSVYGIELCDNPKEGGTTPSSGIIKEARKYSNLFVNVIIRPRGGNFIFSQSEIEAMIFDIQMAVDLGVNGIVSGALANNDEIDFNALEKLKKVSGNLEFTFHKAIDLINPTDVVFRRLIDIGVTRILTSAGEKTALEGSEKIASWINEYGTKLKFVPGGGVRSSNIDKLVKITNASEFHTSASINSKSLTDKLYASDFVLADKFEVEKILNKLN